MPQQQQRKGGKKGRKIGRNKRRYGDKSALGRKPHKHPGSNQTVDCYDNGCLRIGGYTPMDAHLAHAEFYQNRRGEDVMGFHLFKRLPFQNVCQVLGISQTRVVTHRRGKAVA